MQDPGAAECPDHIADCQEILDTPLKFRIGQVAVVHVGKGYLESAKHLAGSEQTALGITETHAVLIGTLIPGPPKKDRHIQRFCKTGTFILCSEIGVGNKKAVHLLCFEFLCDLFKSRIIKQKTFIIYIGDIHKVDVQFPETVCDEAAEFNRCRGAENASSCGCVSDLDLCSCHFFSPFCIRSQQFQTTSSLICF